MVSLDLGYKIKCRDIRQKKQKQKKKFFLPSAEIFLKRIENELSAHLEDVFFRKRKLFFSFVFTL